jgi:hypothetical protein
MPSPSRYGCRDYRAEMILIGLQNRLREEDLTEEERRALEKEIADLESDFYG